MALPGDSEADKLGSLLEVGGSTPSKAQRGAKLFEGGVQMDDIATFFNSLLASSDDHLVATHFDITSKETPAAHLRRIHSLLVSSLQERVPIVAIARAFAALEGKGAQFQWRGLAQHSILIVRVPARIPPEAQGFVCQFVDPGVGELCEGYVYSETARDFRAIKTSGAGFIYSDATNEFVPISDLEERWMDNGFLNFTAPSLFLWTHDVPWYVRTFITLSHGLVKLDPLTL